MNLSFLRKLDRWLGAGLLWLLTPLGCGLNAFIPRMPLGRLSATAKRCVFLKLKGGGSLIIALPTLLALRRLMPQAKFILICTIDTKSYAELTGVFDEYQVIEDTSLIAMIMSTFKTLYVCFRAEICIDLEPNSILAAVFSLLTLAQHRLGFVQPEYRDRAMAYTEAISFNVFAPIYNYYDQLLGLFGGAPASVTASRTQLQKQIPLQPKQDAVVIGLAPFTSDFARERMMPVDTWIKLLTRHLNGTKAKIVILGSEKNKSSGEFFVARMRQGLNGCETVNLCGQGTLMETTATIRAANEIWAIDSGLLHIARLLGVPCHSFWGPTNPAQRLRPIDDLKETVVYHNFACSPCVHIGTPPCGGDNRCMTTMAEDNPNTKPIWCIGVTAP